LVVVGVSVADFCQRAADRVKTDTGLKIEFVEKAQLTFVARLLAMKLQPLTAVPPLLLKPGNCILLSFWHLLPDKRPIIELFVEDEGNDRPTGRSYKDCAAVCGVTLAAKPGFHPAKIGCCLIHSEADNHSHGMGGHCIGVSSEDAGQRTVYVQASVTTLWPRAILGMVSSSIDRHTVVTFEIIRDGAVDESAGGLLNITAGALPSAALEASLQREVDSLKLDLRRRVAVNGVFRCFACPFRAFSKKSLLVQHMQYHRAPFFTAAAVDGTKKKDFAQYKAITAVFDCHAHKAALYGIVPQDDCIRRSAALIREWNRDVVEPEKSLLTRFNLIPFKLVLTADGPQYWRKSKAATALCHSEKTYYTSAFEDLLIGAVLFQQG